MGRDRGGKGFHDSPAAQLPVITPEQDDEIIALPIAVDINAWLEVIEVDVAGAKGSIVDPARQYRVTVSNFMADGGDGHATFRKGTDRLGGAMCASGPSVNL